MANSDGSGLRFEGIKELEKSLMALHEDLQKKAVRAAVASGAQVVRKEAQRIAKQKGIELTGALIENIAIRRLTKVRKPGRTTYEVFVRHGAKAKRAKRVVRRSRRKGVNDFVVSYENNPFYWHMHEFGTSKMPARPFMRPAFEAKKQEAIDAMAKRMRKNIERFKKKYGL